MYKQLNILEAIAEKSFFNTINLTGGELTKAKEQTGLQDQRVLEIFKVNDIIDVAPGLTPFDVHRIYEQKYPKVPVTSIRRSITVLTKKGLLRKTDKMLPGIYGKRNYLWELAK